ncbi:MAG: GNAT family N-acetyltransferase [Candidatus Lokiarchaeota archaeon]|nr:GNAT family N-acetyltransferase [Candidatus Lokiarchaeota archaeon]
MTVVRPKTKIVRFSHEYLDDVAKLAVKSYLKQFHKMPFLPEALKKEERMKAFLQDIIEHYPGVVTIHDDDVIGYFCGKQILSYQDRMNAIYIPEWGHYADDDHSEIYYNMYKEIASTWIDRGYRFHMISVYQAETIVQETIAWLGFGRYIIDGAVNVGKFSIDHKKITEDYEIRVGTLSDLHLVIPLSLELEQYLARAPIFLHKETTNIHYFRKWAEKEGHKFWLAFDDSTPIGFIQIESDAEDVSTIVQDSGSVSITGLYVSPSYRNHDLGKRLLEQAVQWTLDHGYKRLCVDFESVNNIGREFWLKYFKPFSFSYYRYTL